MASAQGEQGLPWSVPERTEGLMTSSLIVSTPWRLGSYPRPAAAVKFLPVVGLARDLAVLVLSRHWIAAGSDAAASHRLRNLLR